MRAGPHLIVAVRERIATRAGEVIAKLHNQGFVHGDLTTSNMLVLNANGALVGVAGALYA